MDAKYELLVAPPKHSKNSVPFARLRQVAGALTFVLVLVGAVKLHGFQTLRSTWSSLVAACSAGTSPVESHEYIPRDIYYNLTISQAWRNPDGGWWRPIYVGNSESPIPTINAREGDIIHLTVYNELYIPSSIHWISMHHHASATWHDGAAGVSTYPILPRANWTAVINTTDQWGARWYSDHMTTAFFDGLYGLIWIRPSPERERPYHFVSSDENDQRDMVEAEADAEHITIFNHQHRTYDNLLSQLQSDGYDPFCFQSVLINGKGRVHCKPDGVHDINGELVDSYGCVKQPHDAVGYDECRTTYADYEIIETRNRRWMMVNLVSTNLHHPFRVSIDSHKMWIIANDAGFVQPQEVDIVEVGQAQRVTIMIKLDQQPSDYTMRFYALSKRQSIQGYAVLRYPHRRTGLQLGPMPQPPTTLSPMDPLALPLPDKTHSTSSLTPYPPLSPPHPATKTLHFTARGAPDPINPYITNYTLNGSPWQLWRAFRTPLILHPNTTFRDPNPIVKDIPLGSVVDIIVQNELDVPVPLYKHNDPTFLIGVGEGRFGWASVEEAVAAGEGERFELERPVRGYLHTLPPRGWAVVRWRVEQAAMTMFHSLQAEHFVMGMLVPLFEGDDRWPEVPESVRGRPHVEFEMPRGMGIFD